jgi:hypothetical protein
MVIIINPSEFLMPIFVSDERYLPSKLHKPRASKDTFLWCNEFGDLVASLLDFR